MKKVDTSMAVPVFFVMLRRINRRTKYTANFGTLICPLFTSSENEIDNGKGNKNKKYGKIEITKRISNVESIHPVMLVSATATQMRVLTDSKLGKASERAVEHHSHNG